MGKIQFKRGTESTIPTLSAGEPGFTTDTFKLFIGDGSTNHEIGGGSSSLSVDDTATVNLSLVSDVITADVITQMSVTADASGLKLDGDSAAPGNNKVYSTNGSGVKGWNDATATYTDEAAQDSVGSILTDSSTIDFTYDDGTPSITAIVIDSSITNDKIRDSGACSVIGRSANSTGPVSDIVAGSNNQVLQRVSNAVGFGQVNLTTTVTGTLPASNGGTGQSGWTTGDLLVGAGGATGKILIGSAGQVLTVVGGTAAWATAYTDENAQDAVGAMIADTSSIALTYTDATPELTADVKSDGITDAMLRNSGACSVIGRSANSTGDPADISASADGQVLRRAGAVLGFGALDLDDTVTGTLGVANGGTNLSSVGSEGQVLTVVGAVPAWATPTGYTDENAQDAVGAMIADTSSIALTYTDATPALTADVKSDGITDAMLRDSGACSVIGRSANSTGDPADISASADGQFLQRAGGALTFATIPEPSHVEGRLTLTSGTPITTSDVSAAGTLYFTPYTGNRISLYDGSKWVTYTFTERSLALSLTDATNYDVFLYDNAGTLTLETTAWTNDTIRATALTLQDGVYVKDGATTRRYLGTIRASGANTCEDSISKRYVWNLYNPIDRIMRVVDTTDSWTYATSVFRPANNNTANSVEYVQGISNHPIRAEVHASILCAGDNGTVNIGIDSSTGNSAQLMVYRHMGGTVGNISVATATYEGYPGIGYHRLYWTERRNAGTITVYGDAAFPGIVQSGMKAEIKG